MNICSETRFYIRASIDTTYISTPLFIRTSELLGIQVVGISQTLYNTSLRDYLVEWDVHKYPSR